MNPGGFRLLLAALVFVSHVSRYNSGRPAVALFFMLSGYWVSRLYEARTNGSVAIYLQDRILRVWPLLATVAIAIVVIGALRGVEVPGSLGSTLLLLGLATRRGDVIGVAWSLDIELQFYLLLPIAATAVGAVAARWRTTVALGLLAALTAFGMVLLRGRIVTVLAYAPVFFAGAMIWYRDWRPSGRLALVSLAVFLIAIAAVFAFAETRALIIKGRDFWWIDPAYVGLCLLLAPFVAWNVHRPSSPLDRHLGNLSFPFYLVHFPIVVAFGTLTSSVVANKLMALAVALAATLVLYWVIDRRFETVRHHLSGRAVRRLSRARVAD